MKTLFKKIALISLPLLLTACGDDDLDPDSISAPDVYDFTSLTDPSAVSSVDYKEATTRLILIEELKDLISSDFLLEYGESRGKDDVIALLNRIYEEGTKSSFDNNLTSVNLYTRASTPTPIKSINFTGDTVSFDTLSEDVNLKEAMPGISSNIPTRTIASNEENGDFIGWEIEGNLNGNSYADSMIQDWFEVIADLLTDKDSLDEFDRTTRFTKNNINYHDLIISFLSASIPYSEISNSHLSSSALSASNNQNDSSSPYTPLEHNWDMAFGYYGAPINMKLKSSASIIAAQTTSVATIDDHVFSIAGSAAQRDLDSPTKTSRLANSFINTTLSGRKLITLDNRALLVDYTTLLISNWEQTLAATLIHHINHSISVFGNTVNLEHWSHMKAYALALQFNPRADADEQTLLDIHGLIGSLPNLDNKDYLIGLLEAREILQNTYSIPLSDIQNW